MIGGDPTKNTKNTRGNEGNTRGNMREITQPTSDGHTYARSSKHKERYKIQSQQRTIQKVTGLLREEVLNSRGDLPLERGLESKGIFSVEAAVSLVE